MKFPLLNICLLIAINSRAQRIEVGPSVNHLSDGIAFIYNHSPGKKFEIGAGMRYQINIFSVNENKRNFSYYQNGYANDFWEHFAFILRPAFKIYGNKFAGIYLQTNFLLSNHSLKSRTYAFNTVTNQTQKEIFFFENAWALESTIGLRAYYNINRKWSIQAASGIGYVWLNHSYNGRALISNTPVYGFNFKRPGATRGDGEVSGLDGLPMLYLGVGYNLNSRLQTTEPLHKQAAALLF